MGEQKRKSIITPTISRTLERVAIASIAAIATRGSSQSITIVALTIFIILVGLEEYGRYRFWKGQNTTLRDVAFKSIRKRRVYGTNTGRSRKRRRRRSTAREGRG